MMSFTLLSNYYKTYFYNWNKYLVYSTSFLKKLYVFISFNTKKLKKILYMLFILESVLNSKCTFILKKKKNALHYIKYTFVFQLQKRCLSQFLSFFFFGLASMDKTYNAFDFKFNFFSFEYQNSTRSLLNFSNNIVSVSFNRFVFFDIFYNRALFDLFVELLKFKVKLIFTLNSIDPLIKRKIFGIYGFKNRYIS